MRLVGAAVNLCLVAMFASQALAESVFLKFAPEPGWTWEIAETRTRSKQVGSSAADVQEGSIRATLAIVARTNGGFEMEWTTTSVTNGGVVAEGILPELLIGVPVRFTADTEGLPLLIAGREALLDAMLVTIQKRVGTPGNTSAIASTRALFANTPPATLARVLLPEATAIGSCHNFNMEPGKLVSVKDPVTALGGQQVDATSTFIMLDRGSTVRPAHIQLTQQIGQGSLSGVITQFIDGAGQTPQASDRAAFASMSRKTVTDCMIDTMSGAATSVVVDMVVQASGMEVKDRRDIRVSRLD
jgi:hypothetical protein